MSDLISRQAAIDALGYCQTYLFDSRDKDKKISLEDAEYAIEQLPSAQLEQYEIGYYECVNVMLKMWNNNVLTNGEYKHIMDKLNAHWAERREE